MKQGFTLIELLVVVLIIGILSAIALPQYTKAVEKSRAAEAIQMLGDLATAEQIYYMSTGNFTDNLDELDIELPNISENTAKTKNFILTVSDASSTLTAHANRTKDGVNAVSDSSDPLYYGIGLSLSSNGTLTRWCAGVSGSTPTSTTSATATCKSIAGNGTGLIK